MDEWDLDSSPKSASRGRRSVESETPAVSRAEPADTRPQSQPAKSEPHPPKSESQPPKAPGPAVPRRPRPRISVLLAAVAGGLLLVLLGVLIGFFVARSQGAADRDALATTQVELSAVRKALAEAEERSAGYYRTNQVLQAQIEDLRSGSPGATGSSSTTVPSGPGTTFADGVFLVGKDIMPGTYDGVVTGSTGYWARLKDTDGLVSSITANGLPRGPFVLTVVETDRAVELRGVNLKAR